MSFLAPVQLSVKLSIKLSGTMSMENFSRATETCEPGVCGKSEKFFTWLVIGY